MKLKEFVENNLEQNSIFRVVAESTGGHYDRMEKKANVF